MQRRVEWNNRVIYQINPTNYNIQNVGVNVQANEGVNTLTFVGEGTADGNGISIDNVTLSRDETGNNIIINGNFETRREWIKGHIQQYNRMER